MHHLINNPNCTFYISTATVRARRKEDRERVAVLYKVVGDAAYQIVAYTRMHFKGIVLNGDG